MIARKLKSASLQLFCTRDELVRWLQMLLEKRGLGVLAFLDDLSIGIAADMDQLRAPSVYRIFLHPQALDVPAELTMNDVRAREWGWIDVRPGREGESGVGPFLQITTIQAEDYGDSVVRPVKDVEWLRRKLKTELSSGVLGRNTVTGGESVYRGIQFSDGALRQLQANVTWVQDTSGRTVFEPLSRGVGV